MRFSPNQICRFFSNFHLNVINISSYKKPNNAKEFFQLDSDYFFPLGIRNKLLTFYKVISVLGKCKEYTKKACSIITSLASPTKISVTNFEKSFFSSAFSCIWTEYGDLWSKSPHLVRMQENTD